MSLEVIQHKIFQKQNTCKPLSIIDKETPSVLEILQKNVSMDSFCRFALKFIYNQKYVLINTDKLHKIFPKQN